MIMMEIRRIYFKQINLGIAWSLKALVLILAFLNIATRSRGECVNKGTFDFYIPGSKKYLCSNMTRDRYQTDIKEIMESNDVKHLELTHINLSTIDTELFSAEKYSEVYDLTIKKCGVTTVEGISFNNFIRLDNLYILGNKINNFSIKTPPNLVKLDISNNNIQRFNITCRNLKNFICNNNSLTIVQTNSFHNCIKLREIQMRSSNIKILQKDAFLGLYYLRGLDLTDNPITNIEPGVFNGLTNLYRINLTDIFKNIKELKRGVFSGLEHLDNFTLALDNVEVIEPGIFIGFDSLYDFNVKYILKNIYRIQKDQFKGLSNLRTLDLSGLNILHVESEAFNGLDRVHTILFQNNNISSLHANAFRSSDLVWLSTINLSNTGINTNNLKFALGLQNVTELILCNNSIGDLQKNYFSGQQLLERLDISFSNIENLEPETFYGMKLKSLNLRSNRLTTFPCNIFDSNSKITDLNLSNNQIENISICSFQNLLRLGRLNLQYNKISHLDDRTFSALGILLILNLSNNMLSDLSEQLLHPLDNLMTLGISNNRFTHFNPELVLPHLRYLNEIHLSGNPWSCRNLISIRKYLSSRDIKFNSGIKNFTVENISGMECISENVTEVIDAESEDKDMDIELNRYIETIDNSSKTLIEISRNANANSYKTLEQLNEITEILKNVFNSNNRTLEFFKAHFITNSTLHEEDNHDENSNRIESKIQQGSNNDSNIDSILLAISIVVICYKLVCFGYKVYQKYKMKSKRTDMEMSNIDGGAV